MQAYSTAKVLFKAIYSQNDYTLSLEEETVELIRQNFDPKLPIMPIIVAGTFGTGKSTWLNVLHFLMDKKMVNHDTFKTGDNMVAATEGIWVYPKPLFWENNTQQQILLVDMEGQGGIKELDQEKTDSMLKKLYMLGLTLASSFVLHVQARPTVPEMEMLKKTFLDYEAVGQKIGVGVPPVTIFISQAQKADQATQFKKLLATSFKFPCTLIENIRFQPQQKLPLQFVERKDYSCLSKADAYIREVQLFMKEQWSQNTRRVITRTPMNVVQFLDILENAFVAINSPSFEQFFASNLGNFVRKTLASKVKSLRDELELDAMKLAESQDVSGATLNIDRLVQNTYENFNSFVHQSFESNIIQAANFDIEQQKQLLTSAVDVSISKATSIFNQRKIQATAYEQIRKDVLQQELDQQQKAYEAKLQKEKADYEDRLRKQEVARQKEIEESKRLEKEKDRQYQEKWQNMNKKSHEEEMNTLQSPFSSGVCGMLEVGGKVIGDHSGGYVSFKGPSCKHKLIIVKDAQDGRIVTGTVVRIKIMAGNVKHDTMSATGGITDSGYIEYDIDRKNDRQLWIVKFIDRNKQNIEQHPFRLHNYYWDTDYIYNYNGEWVCYGKNDKSVCYMKK